MKWQEGSFAACAVAVIAAIAVSVTLPSYNNARRADILTAERALSDSAYDLSLLIHVIFSSPRDRFQASTGLFALSGVLPHDEFLRLALAVHPMYGISLDYTITRGIYDLAWAPIIHDEDRIPFETGVSNTTGKSFQFKRVTAMDGRERAANASFYAPILDLPTADITDDPLRMWGVDILSLPMINATVREAIRTKKAQVTAGLCYFSPLTDRDPSRFSCAPYRTLLIQPIVASAELGSLSPVDPVTGPYSSPELLSIIRKHRGVAGEVIGILIGTLNWNESGDKIVGRLPPGVQSEASEHMSMFIEDITDVRGEAYPHANCSRESPQVLLHNIPFGKGSPILLFPVDEPFAEGVAEKLYRTQASRSQIMCVANKQWNVMLTLPYPWLGTLVGNSRREVLMVAAAILIPMAAIVVLFLGSWVAQFVADRTQVDLEERHKKVNLEIYEKAVLALAEEFKQPVALMSEAVRSMLGAGGALAGVTAGIPRVVLEVLKANLPRMTVRLHALHAVAQNRAGKLVFPNEEFDVREFVREVAELHRSNAVVPVKFLVDHNVPQIVSGPKSGIEQVLMNGLLNSCQHCTRRVEIPRMHRHSHSSRSSDDTEDSGLGLIRLEVHKNPVKQMLEFRVIDNGPGLGGFTEEQLLAWWDDGVVDSRGLPSLRPQSRPLSTFGLPFSNKVARAMGGNLSIRDDPGRTNVTVLKLLVPFAEPAAGGTFGVSETLEGVVEPLGAIMQPLEEVKADDTQAFGWPIHDRTNRASAATSHSADPLFGSHEHDFDSIAGSAAAEAKSHNRSETPRDVSDGRGSDFDHVSVSSRPTRSQRTPRRVAQLALQPLKTDACSDVATVGTLSPSPLATVITPSLSPPGQVVSSPRRVPNDVSRTSSAAESFNTVTTVTVPSYLSTPFVGSPSRSGGSSSIMMGTSASGRTEENDSSRNSAAPLLPPVDFGNKPIRVLVFEPDQTLIMLQQAKLMTDEPGSNLADALSVSFKTNLDDISRELSMSRSVQLNPADEDAVLSFSDDTSHQPYDVCVLEVDGSHGLPSRALLSNIKRIDPKFPVVAVTSDPRNSHTHSLEAEGYSFVLQRPYNSQYFLQVCSALRSLRYRPEKTEKLSQPKEPRDHVTVAVTPRRL